MKVHPVLFLIIHETLQGVFMMVDKGCDDLAGAGIGLALVMTWMVSKNILLGLSW